MESKVIERIGAFSIRKEPLLRVKHGAHLFVVEQDSVFIGARCSQHEAHELVAKERQRTIARGKANGN
jgi:hypothetical protein